MENNINPPIAELTTQGYILDPSAFRSSKTEEVIHRIIKFLANDNRKLAITSKVYTQNVSLKIKF